MVSRSTPAYSVHPSVAYVQAILKNLKGLTGRDLDEWLAFVKAKGPGTEKERRSWLKAQGLGSTQAWFLAERSVGASAHAFDDTPEGYLALAPQYVDRQFSGKKAPLRPVADQLLILCRDLGPDARVCPCETIIPIYREHVIAQVKALASRLDFSLALGDPALVRDASGRLIDTGGFQKKDRLTHRLEVRAEADIDEVLKGFLKRAYDRDIK